jgi:hypothetical protein
MIRPVDFVVGVSSMVEQPEVAARIPARCVITHEEVGLLRLREVAPAPHQAAQPFECSRKGGWRVKDSTARVGAI